jgi:hypothetical protein
MTFAWIAVWSAALLLWPGLVIWRLAGPRDMPWPLQIAPAFALSLAVVSLLGWSGHLLGIGFAGVRASSLAVLVVATVLSPIAFWRRVTPEGIKPGWTLWAGVAIAVAAGVSALYSGTWLSLTADTFYHLAAIRSVLEHGTALPQEVFFSSPVPAPDPSSGSWHLALALISNLAGADPVMVWRAMTVAMAPVTVLAFFMLALSISRSGIAAVISTALYVVLALSLDFRSAANPNRFGLLLVWLALALAVRYVGNVSRRELAIAAPIAFGASAVHPGLGPFLLAALACGVVAALLVRAQSLMRVAEAAVVVGAAALPLLIVDLSTLAAPAPYAAMALTSPLPLHTFDRPWTWVWPGFWFHDAGVVLGSAFAISLVRHWRAGDVGAGLLVTALIVAPVAALTPIFATTYSGQYLLARVANLLEPLAWVSWGWGLMLAIGALRSRVMVPAAVLLVISVVAALPAAYSGPWARFALPAGQLRSFATSRSTDLTVAWRDRLAAIAKLPERSVLLAEPAAAYELAGLTGRQVVAVPFSHTPHQVEVRDGPRRRADALDAVQGRLDPAGLAGVLEHYGVTEVIVDMERTEPGAWAQLAEAEILTPIASGDRWRLYHYEPERLDGFLDLPTREAPGPDLQRSGAGPEIAVAGRGVFARLEWNQRNPSQARLEAKGIDSRGRFGRQVMVGAEPTETLALPIPLDAPVNQYALNLVLGDGRTLPLGEFEVGRLFQAEDLGGVVPGGSANWSTVDGPAYQGGLAAVAVNSRATAHQPTPPIAPGNYCVAVRAYDDGSSQPNVIEASLGGAGARLAWSGSVAGMRVVRAPLTVDGKSGQMVMRVVERGQAAVIIDSLEIYPAVVGDCGSD